MLLNKFWNQIVSNNIRGSPNDERESTPSQPKEIYGLNRERRPLELSDRIVCKRDINLMQFNVMHHSRCIHRRRPTVKTINCGWDGAGSYPGRSTWRVLKIYLRLLKNYEWSLRYFKKSRRKSVDFEESLNKIRNLIKQIVYVNRYNPKSCLDTIHWLLTYSEKRSSSYTGSRLRSCKILATHHDNSPFTKRQFNLKKN